MNGMNFWRRILLLGGLLLAGQLPGQIRIDTSYSAAELVSEVLLGKRIRVRNVRFAGSEEAIAQFIDPSDNPLIGAGIVLSTGRVRDIPGPNKSPGSGINLGERGYRQLRGIGRGQTYDAAVLEFEFMAAQELLTFNFVFASEEYTEYVFSQFNDVFAFFITGPGIQGVKNLAVIPRNQAPITVNTVNHRINGKNYLDNNHFDRTGNPKVSKAEKLSASLLEAIEFDGMTTLLKAQTRVKPGGVYKIRIAIADVGDGRYDSAVFLEANSFTSLPRDPIKRAEILRNEYADARRMFDPVAVGEEPLPPGTVTPEDSPVTDLEPAKWRAVVEFAFDEAQLSASAQDQLRKGYERWKANPESEITVQGHTDNQGSRGYNDRLSRRRAEAVRRYLVELGIPSSSIKIDWYGFDQPAETNSSESGRARNRRVEVTLQ
ncbi:MAG: OmpA family protein [Bacteroidota bacterium]